MSDPPLKLQVASEFDSKGTDAALAALARLQQAQAKAAGGGPSGGVQQQQALAGATRQTAAATNQAANANLHLSASATQAAASQNQLATQALGTIKALTGIGGVLAVVTKGVELAQLGAQADQTRQAFDGLAESAGTTGTALLGALRSASKGEISDLNLELAANKAQLLGVADSAAEFSTLMDIARDRAQKMGIDTTQAFSDLVTGLGRGSALILDNLGITVSVTAANEAYALSIGKTVSQLSEAEKKQALINAVLTQGRASIAASGGALDTTAGSFARVSAAAENAKAALGGAIAELLRIPAEPVARGLQGIADGLNQVATANDQLRATAGTVIEGAASYEEYGKRLTFVNEQLEPLGARLATLTSAQYDFAKSLIETGTGAADASTQTEQYANVINAAAAADTAWGEGHGQLLQQMMGLAQGTEAERMAVESLSAQFNAGALGGDAFRGQIAALSTEQNANAQAAALDRIESEHLSATHLSAAQSAAAFADQIVQLTGMTTESANASMLDTQAKETQALQMQLLTAQTDQTVAAFLRLNPGIDQAGIASLVTAGKIPPLIGQLAALVIAANSARASLAWLNGGGAQQDFRAGERSLGSASAGSAQQSYQASQRAREAAIALAQAQHEQVMQTGLASDKLKTLKADLDKATASYGANSAEAVRAETALKAFQNSQIKGGGGGGAAGAASKTAGQLASIQTKSNQQLEDAEKAHVKRLLDIEDDYATKSAAILKKSEVTKRGSRADFYDALTKATPDIGGDVANQLASEYEAAFQQAREAEQRGEVALARDLEKANNDRLHDELEYQKAVADARKEGNEAEIQRLQAIHELRAAEQAEQIKQVAEGGDELQNEKQKALDDEAEKYAEQTGKIADTADRKTAAITKSFDTQADAAQRWADKLEQAAHRASAAIESVSLADSSDGGSTGDGGSASSGGSDTGTSSSSGGSSSTSSTQGASRNQGASRSGDSRASSSSSSSSSGGGSASDIITSLKELNSILDQLLKIANQYGKYAAPIEKYKASVGAAIDTLNAAFAFRKNLTDPGPPIDMAVVQTLLDESQAVVSLFINSLLSVTKQQAEAAERYKQLSDATIGPIQAVVDLRKSLAEPAPALDGAVIRKLVAEVQGVAYLMSGILVDTTEDQAASAERWQRASEALIRPLLAVIDLRKGLAEPAPVLTKAQVEKLVAEVVGAAYLMRQVILPTTEDQAADAEAFQRASEAALGPMLQVVDLRKSLVEPGPVLTKAIVEKLIAEVVGATYLMRSALLPTTEDQASEAERFQRAAEASIGPMLQVVDLRKSLSDPVPALDMATVQALADEVVRVTALMESTLIPTTEEQAAASELFQRASEAAIGSLKAIVDLRKSLSEPASALDVVTVLNLAQEAVRATALMRAILIPTTEDQASEAERFQRASEASISPLTAVTDLRKSLTDLGPAITDDQIRMLADEAARVVATLEGYVIPVTEDEAKAIQTWADAVGGAVAALKAPLDLSRQLFDDYYVSPTDAQLSLLATDAQRIVDWVVKAASVYDTKGLEAAKAFGEANGAIISSFKDELLFVQALNSGEFTGVSTDALASFEDDTRALIDVAGRLGASAAAIPTSDLAALGNVTSTMSAVGDMWLKLASVPYGDLSAIAANTGSAGMGSTSVTLNIYQQPGQDAQQLANYVISQLNQRTGARR